MIQIIVKSTVLAYHGDVRRSRHLERKDWRVSPTREVSEEVYGDNKGAKKDRKD
jgi:hypothetical protein